MKVDVHPRSSHWRRAILVALTCLLAIVAPPAFSDNHNSVVDDILDRNKMRVGLSSFIPWAMRAKNGEFIGFEVDVAKAVAEDMGVELEIIPTAWDGLIPALLSKKIDIIIAGMSVTPARNLQINFTDFYSVSGLGIVAHRQKAKGLNRIEDFNRPDITFALRRGTAGVIYVQENLPKAQIKQFDDEATVRQELLNGQVHAWVTSEPGPYFAALDYPDKLFLPVEGLLRTHREGFALRKGDVDGLNFFNNWIATRWESGWLQERHDHWFKSRDWKSQVE